MTKNAIVTGASRGFGRGIALVLATEGNFKYLQQQEINLH